MKSRFAAISFLLAGLCAALLTSCQTSTPMSRITKNPVMFRVLSPEQQLMVQQGKICEGMSKEAVFLAWGNPNTEPVLGQQNGVSYEKWVYLIYQPVMMNTVGFSSGCWGGGPCYGPAVGTSTAYVPQESAWVMFENDKVTSWERRK